MNSINQLFDINKFRVSCGECGLAELCLPWGIGHDGLERLEKIIKKSRPIQRGEFLLRSGDNFQSIYAIKSGTMKAYKMSEDGHEQILGFYLPGEILGLDAIENREHLCNIVALETSSACAIPFSQLEELCRKIPALQHQLYRLMSRELSSENESLLLLGKKSAEKKIATFLINLSTRLHHLGYSAIEFRLPMSRQEIGNYLGLTVETVSRIFTRLQKDNLLSVDHKLIKITNMPALRSLCAGD